MKRTGPSNPELSLLIQELRKLSTQKNVPLWDRIAYDLEMPTRKRRIVNLSRINRFTKQGETVIVPGKVLGAGVLDHEVTIAAFTFSKSALDQISKSKAKAITLSEFIKQDIKGKNVKIIG